MCLLAVLPAIPSAAYAQQDGRDLAELIGKLPADTPTEAEAVYNAVLSGGAEGVASLANMVIEPGKGDDAKARYALQGLAVYVCRPDAEAERKLVAGVLAGLLDGDSPASVKAFWIRRLQVCGQAEAVGPLANALRDEALCEPAAQALLAIGADAEVFRNALPDVPLSCRATIVQALGSKRDAKAVPALLKLATADDRDVRTAAIEALGNIGDASAKDKLLQAAGAEGYGRYVAADACLKLARRLVEADKPRDAESIYRSLLKTHTKPQDRQVRCAAVLGLAETLGENAIDDLLSAMKETDPQVRAAAIDAGADMPGKEATGKWIAAARNAQGEVKASVVELLARRGDAQGFPTVLEAMKDEDESVRVAAIAAAAKLGKDESVDALVAALDGSDAESSAAGRELRDLPGQKASKLIAAHVASASPRVRAQLLRVLAARGASEHLALVLEHTADDDASVRIAAMEATGTLGDSGTVPKLVELLKAAPDDRHRDAAEKALESLCRKVRNPDRTARPLLDALGGSPVEVRCALLRVLGKVPADAALDALRQALKHDNDSVSYTALRAIAGWADERAADDLLALAKDASDIKNHVLTLQGFIRVVGDSRKLTPQQKVSKLRVAVELARRADEKMQALGELRDVHTAQSLALVAECMDDEAVAQEAASAAVYIAGKMKVEGEDQASVVLSAMEKVLKVAESERLRKEAHKVASKHMLVSPKPGEGGPKKE